MEELLVQVGAVREGGAVQRCHTFPQHHGPYDVAQHSYGAVSLLLLLHPNPSLNLIKAVQWHDIGERWLGDMPSPAKTGNQHLAEVYEAEEEKILTLLGLYFELSNQEENWLKAVDILDLWLWCREEEFLGNRSVTRMRLACEAALDKRSLKEILPMRAEKFYHAQLQSPYTRLSDVFEEVRSGLGEARTGLG
jgi:5'-deoxynucleotidase YfbR-like HD superfamily hydrolase